jgi:hypothetical protein
VLHGNESKTLYTHPVHVCARTFDWWNATAIGTNTLNITNTTSLKGKQLPINRLHYHFNGTSNMTLANFTTLILFGNQTIIHTKLPKDTPIYMADTIKGYIISNLDPCPCQFPDVQTL